MSATLNPPRGGPPSAWHWRALLLAPHRLGFFLAMGVLVASGLWWAAVQLDRAGAGLGLSYAVSPSLTHSAVMTFGFFPLFFCGFLFTAGPKWLGVPGPSARDILGALVLIATGWLLWLAAGHAHALLAAAALLPALGGMLAVTVRFWGLVLASRLPDRVHARAIGAALVAGCACIAGLALAVLLGAPGAARAFVLTGLWAFVVVVYAAVAHRMIPFFTSSALPMVAAWRPFWVLGLLLGVALFEAAAVWVEGFFPTGTAWLLLRGALEAAAGAMLAWLVFAWGFVQSMKVRLLAMLHLGFLWLGLGLGLSGASQLIGALSGEAVLPLGALHAVTIGGLGSLMLAMVTRVSCGHSGRPLVADNPVWALFWLLQATTLLRIAASVPAWNAAGLAAAAAVVWAGVMLTWGMRYGSWYGRRRADGRPG
ncbi:MAG TPA: NnrS family protein [Ramlibacter sp.]|nr:NnrS family protein [Ramlibacter sp.]